MHKKAILLLVILACNSLVFSQYYNKLEIVKKSTTIGYVNYFDGENTKNFLNNRQGFSLNLIQYKDNNVSYGATYNYNSSNLQAPLTIGVFTVPANNTFYLNTFDVHFGYCINLFKNITLEPYSGITETTIIFFNEENGKSKEYFKTGIPLGIRLNWNIKLGKMSDHFFVVFINNNLNYNRLNKLNSNLDSYSFQTEFGIGIMKEELVINSRSDRKKRR